MRNRILLRWLSLVGLVLILAVTPLGSRAQGGVNVVINAVDSATFPLVKTNVTVIDAYGIPVPELDVSSFQAFEDGRQVSISTAAPVVSEEVPISIAVVIDVSGSMQGQPLEDAKQAAIAFIDNLGPQDWAAIIAFGEHVNLDEPFPQIDPAKEIDFSTDRNSLKVLIEGLDVPDVHARTPLYDAIYKAVRMTAQRPAGNRAVMIFTDGSERTPQEAASMLGPEAPVSEATRHGIPVFTIGLGDEIDETYLTNVATVTGGTYQRAPDSAALTQLFANVSDQLKLRYVLQYSSMADADGAEHGLQIKVTTTEGEGSNITTFVATPPEVPGLRLDFKEEETIEGTVSITPMIFHADPVDKVEYLIDGTSAFTTTLAPFTYVWDTTTWENVTHTLTIRVFDAEGDMGTAEVSLVVANPVVRGPLWPLVLGVLLVLGLLSGTYLVLMRHRPRGPTCRDCGRALDPTWQKCPYCGSPVRGPEPITAEAEVVRPGVAEEVTAEGLPSEELIAWLVVERGEHRGHQFRLGVGETTIGRAGTSDIVISDTTVSRSQAKVKLEKGDFYIYDLGATNPTRVNDKEITRHRLDQGDKVEIGDTVLVFKRI